jgi:formate hydrogenlyase subunit 6/NADH:ubiquinone oxidoreductase subunit I
MRVTPEPLAAEKLALLGVRACEIAAIAVQDRVFLQGPYIDPDYQARRANTCVIAINCAQAGGTCFCTSMGTGPEVRQGYDLSLTEVIDDTHHQFVLRCGSPLGADLLADLPHRVATPDEVADADSIIANTAASMGHTLDTNGLPELLARNREHPVWDETAQRCLTCGNCTQACPTCFCVAVEDTADLTGQHAERWRRWDSCFNLDYSHIAGGSIRVWPPSRYRQWMTHKLSTWWDQFGTSGCVGCGRCITWCPTGIDITAVAREIRERDGEHSRKEKGGA